MYDEYNPVALRLWVFNPDFIFSSVIHVGQYYWWRKHEYTEKTIVWYSVYTGNAENRTFQS